MSTIKADNYANRVGDKSVPAETVVNGTAKAWINFDGTGTTNRASFNVSSRTNVATGDYAITFINAMPDANYALSGVTTIEAGNIGVVTSRQDASTFNRTTTSFALGVRNTVSGFATNKPDISVSVSR